jgi:hypothetical protein
LPDKIMEWAGLERANPVVPFEDTEEGESLAGLNDGDGYGREPWTFGQIADVIEKYL